MKRKRLVYRALSYQPFFRSRAKSKTLLATAEEGCNVEETASTYVHYSYSGVLHSIDTSTADFILHHFQVKNANKKGGCSCKRANHATVQLHCFFVEAPRLAPRLRSFTPRKKMILRKPKVQPDE